MPADVIMPALGMAQETGKVLRWLKQDGDAVAKGEPLLEVETDKVTVELESPADGTLAGVRAGEGADVPVGEVIAVVLAAGEAAAPEPVGVATPSGDATPRHDKSSGDATPRQAARRPLASPKARKLAASRGVDVAALAGTGPNGAVTAADVEAAAVPAGNANRGGEPPAGGAGWRGVAGRTSRAGAGAARTATGSSSRSGPFGA